MASPVASVVIVDWKQPELTARAVSSVLAQEVPGTIEVVIVVNEAAPGATAAFGARFPSAVVVENLGNEGFAGGVTSGIAVASAPVIVLLNNDAVAAPGFLAAGLGRLASSSSSVAAVAARIVLEGRYERVPSGAPAAGSLVGVQGQRWRRVGDGASGTELTNSTGVVLTRSGNCFDRDWLAPVVEGAPPSDLPLFAFTGGAVFLRAAAAAEVGGFDTRFFMYYEDVDLSWRLRLAGYDIVYEPSARVIHRHAGSSDHDSPLIRVYSMRNRTLTLLKNAPAGAAAGVVVRSLIRAALDLVRPPAFLPPAGWRVYLGSVARFLPVALMARRGATATARRALFRAFAR